MDRSSKSKRFEIVLLISLLLMWMVNLFFVYIILSRTIGIQKSELTITSSGQVPDMAVCIPCATERREENGTATSARANKAVVSIDDVQMCCDDKHDDLVNFLHVMMAWSSPRETSDGLLKRVEARSSAQLFMDQKHFEGKTITWSTEPCYNAGHVEGGMRVINNSIQVHDGGLYYIHSSLNLFTRHSSYDVTVNHATHSIIRTNLKEPSSSEVLLSKSSSLSYKPGRFLTSVLGEFIDISSGDIISVSLSNYSYVYNSSVSNTFGIYSRR